MYHVLPQAIFMSFYFLRLFAISQVSSNKCKKDMVVRKNISISEIGKHCQNKQKKKKQVFCCVTKERHVKIKSLEGPSSESSIL